MPVIEISALRPGPPVDVARVMGRVCMRVATAMQVPPRQVWATWRDLEPGEYVEGDVAAAGAGQPRDSHPPIVELKAFQGRPAAMIRAALEAIADVLCEELGMEKGNAFVTYTELRSGRVYTGGAVRE